MSKTARVKPESLLDWIKPNSLDLFPEKEVLFQSKPNQYSRLNVMVLGILQVLQELKRPQLCLTLTISKSQKKLSLEKENICTNLQGGHGTGKTGNLAVNFSRQGKHREFSKFNFLHRENCGNTGKILKI